MSTPATRATGATVLMWMREDLPRREALEYWRGPHSQLVARTPGILECRQHHFAADAAGLWPGTEGVETAIPEHRRIDGTSEVWFTGPAANLKSLRHNRAVLADEVNVFGRTILHATAPSGGRWHGTSPGRTGARAVVLLRRRDSVAARALARLLHDRLGPALSAHDGVTEVRTQAFLPFKAWMWNSSGVAHDYAPDQQLHGVLYLGARDEEALRMALTSNSVAELQEEVSSLCAAAHAYPVAATYTYRRDGRPTLPQVRPEKKPPLQPVRRAVPSSPPVTEPSRPFPPARLLPLPGHGAEDVVVGADGQLYCGVEGGGIVRLDPDSSATSVVAETGGRPLGLEALPDGRLLVCDAHRGLLRVAPSSGAVETLTQYVDDVPLRFCSNATAQPDGTIWFTESTTRFDFEHYLGAFLEHRPSGRLLRRDPDGSVDVVLDDLYFANGVALAPDGQSLLLVETGAYRISRVDLTGPDAGRRRTLVENLPGFPDNLSAFRDGRAWVALTNPRNATLDRAGSTPGAVRKLLWRLPDRLSPNPEAIVWARAITPDGAVVEDLHQQREDFHMVTGAVEHQGVLYLASPQRGCLLRVTLAD